jgi:hypothetical protein
MTPCSSLRGCRFSSSAARRNLLLGYRQDRPRRSISEVAKVARCARLLRRDCATIVGTDDLAKPRWLVELGLKAKGK